MSVFRRGSMLLVRSGPQQPSIGQTHDVVPQLMLAVQQVKPYGLQSTPGRRQPVGMFAPIKCLAVSFRGRMKARIPAQAATPQLALQAAERFAVGPSLAWAAIGHGWGGIIVTVHGSCNCNGSCRMELDT